MKQHKFHLVIYIYKNPNNILVNIVSLKMQLYTIYTNNCLLFIIVNSTQEILQNFRHYLYYMYVITIRNTLREFTFT